MKIVSWNQDLKWNSITKNATIQSLQNYHENKHCLLQNELLSIDYKIAELTVRKL